MRKWFCGFAAVLLLCGCAAEGAALDEWNGKKEQLNQAADTLVFQEAMSYQNQTVGSSYAVQVEQTSGPVLTLLSEHGVIDKLIVHEDNHTKWIQIFDDRILCLTGDDGNIQAELLHDLSSFGDFETIVKCASDPVSLTSGRSFQKVAGAEEGSLQIATDNIDFWMKVSAEKKMEQVRLYFSDLPMMTLTYTNELPLFPNVDLNDYPAYFDVMNLSEENLMKNGYELTDGIYTKKDEEYIQEIVLSDFRLDYALKEEKHTIRLVYDNLTLMGIHTANETYEYCEVVLSGEREISDEIRCDAEKEQECIELFEQLKEDFK